MSTTSFKTDKAEVQEAVAAPEQHEQLPAVANQKLPDAGQHHAGDVPGIGGLKGEFDERDFAMPRINIIQAVGPLSEDFDAGSVVYNRDLVLLPASKDPKNWSDPLHVTVLNAMKQYQQNVDYNADEQPELVDSLKEVKARGGTIEWANDEKPTWRPLLTVLLLIEATDELACEFSVQGPDGKAYELALWALKGAAYNRAGKAINTAARFALRNKQTGQPELHKGKWTLQIRREKLGSNSVFVPRLRQTGKHDDEFVNFVAGLL